jgi:A-factor biosynthesis hotdog domain
MHNLPILVADSFSTFANLPQVLPVSRLMDQIELGEGAPSVVILGQGVTESWVGNLKSAARRSGINLEILGEERLTERASRSSSHKRRRENVLITEPRMLSSSLFEADIVIDEGCELLLDHSTGYHLQGMVLIEAGRQMFLAVIERHLRRGRPSYAVINHLNTKFYSFAFPLPMTMVMTLSHQESANEHSDGYTVEIDFNQNGRTITRIETKFTAIDPDVIASKEAGMASSAAVRAAQSYAPVEVGAVA